VGARLHDRLTTVASSDYNGFRLNPGAAVSFRWNVGASATAPGGGGGRGGDAGQGAAAGPGFVTLAEYVAATRQDQNSVTLDYDVFVNVPKLDRDPKTVQRLYDFRNFDFRLKPGSSAIRPRRGAAEYQRWFHGEGTGPRALELGQPLPTYGPRR
jgi:hypothetical protein